MFDFIVAEVDLRLRLKGLVLVAFGADFVDTRLLCGQDHSFLHHGLRRSVII